MKEFSVIGRVIDVQGSHDEETGVELTPTTFREGWHVNMTELLPELAQYQVFPAAPCRVYAGSATVFLRFDSAEQWEQIVSSWAPPAS